MHYWSFQKQNDYIQAIQSVGEILQYYDSDNKIPVYGFGAQLLPFNEITSHCFALNGNFFDPETNGIDGVLKTYKKACKSIYFNEPTYFRQIIRLAAEYANSEKIT